MSSWKFWVKKKIEKGLSWEKIKAKEPMLDEEEIGRASCRERVCQYV